jgi:CHAT domain-containing protein/tetratricopeptide (TPR) repeat protein
VLHTIFRVLLLLVLALSQTKGIAQTIENDEISSSFQQVSPEEAEKLRAILSEPVPAGVPNQTLQSHFQAKRAAADRLGDVCLHIQLYRQWVAALPEDLPPKINLSNMLSSIGQYTEAIQLTKEAIEKEKTQPLLKEYRRINLGWEYANSGQYAEAQKTLDLALVNITAVKSGGLKGIQFIRVQMIQTNAMKLQSVLYGRNGRWSQAVEAASEAVQAGREYLKLSMELPADPFKKTNLLLAASDLGSALQRKSIALGIAGRFGEADETLKDYIRLAREQDLPPGAMAGIYQTAASLRLQQREFALSESFYRKAQQVKAKLGFHELDQVDYANLIETMEGQHRWNDALAAFAHLDDLAGTDASLQKRVKLSYERGYAYLASGQRLLEATDLLRELADDLEKRYPATHFFVAQARGLQAVAMWRSGEAERQAKALSLLQMSVRDYMRPDNMEMETSFVRKDVRQLIFATYLEAMFASNGVDRMDAMAPADWVRGGMVQEALADAAFRSAVSDPAMSTMVRADQDQKNEIEALRKYLAGDAGGSYSQLPEIATQMRARVAELDGSRHKLQQELQAKFPDYDRLVRPTPPSVADIRKALVADEALVMLLPTDDSVYVWAVTSDGKDSSARVSVTKSQLNQLVRDLRHSLDFAEMGNVIRPFNATAANDLYQRLLAPMTTAIASKQHLVVAAGGVLGQFPFGVLLTQPVKKIDENAPWLIKQAAISYVPSVSAWLAVKQFSKAKSAPEAMAAWGDPQFNIGRQTASANVSETPNTRQVVLTRASTVVDLEKEDPHSAIRYADIPALPETRDELVAIAGILQADPKNDLHLGPQASKASVLQSSKDGEMIKKRVIAFATHGLMAGDLPHLTQPALALAATGHEDQDPLGALLTLDEVLNLKLNADWVILSACNTAAADGQADEALSGLARGFFYAGSKSMLVTHWSVDSESAKLLTTSTLSHYMADANQRKAESLRQAMLSVMTNPQYRHPAFWAPYALVGDGGR